MVLLNFTAIAKLIRPPTFTLTTSTNAHIHNAHIHTLSAAGQMVVTHSN